MVAFGQGGGWQVHDATGRRKYPNGHERQRFFRTATAQDRDTQALAYLLAFTGCRISEALATQRHQLDALECKVMFQTLKRRRVIYRAVPVPEIVVTLLLALPVRDDGRFFGMHRSTAWRRIKRMMRQAEIDGPMACCRGLRHGFGIHAAGRNVPPNLIQRWMGHASPTTTAIYLDAVGVEERAFATRMW
jgi:integrase